MYSTVTAFCMLRNSRPQIIECLSFYKLSQQKVKEVTWTGGFNNQCAMVIPNLFVTIMTMGRNIYKTTEWQVFRTLIFTRHRKNDMDVSSLGYFFFPYDNYKCRLLCLSCVKNDHNKALYIHAGY